MEERKTTVLLKDGTQIEGSGSIQNLIVMCDSQEAAEELWGKWTEENLEGAKVDGLEIQGLVKSNDYKFIDQRGDKYQLILQARQLTASEREIKRVGNVVDAMAGGGDPEMEQILAAQQTRRFMQLQVDAAALPDEQAMEVADLYEEWQPDKAYKQGKILKYGKNADGETQLYRVNQEYLPPPLRFFMILAVPPMNIGHCFLSRSAAFVPKKTSPKISISEGRIILSS